jgi:hypothetical protein
MTILARLALFLSSYAPLFGVFALLGSFGTGWPVEACIGIALAGPALLAAVLLGAAKGIASQEMAVETVQSRDGDALAYVATYLVPFAAINATTAREQGALALFLVLIAVLYVRADLFYINPLLAVFGYRLYQIVTPTDASVVLITKRPFQRSHTNLPARRLGEYVYWERK